MATQPTGGQPDPEAVAAAIAEPTRIEMLEKLLELQDRALDSCMRQLAERRAEIARLRQQAADK